MAEWKGTAKSRRRKKLGLSAYATFASLHVFSRFTLLDAVQACLCEVFGQLEFKMEEWKETAKSRRRKKLGLSAYATFVSFRVF